MRCRARGLRRSAAVVAVAVAACALAGAWATWASAVPDQPTLTVGEVDVSGFPLVRITVALPSELTREKPSFEVRENGTVVHGVEALALEPERAVEPATVVLLLDTSGSMAGGPLAHARAAAIRFVEALDQGSRIAVVTFSDKPAVVAAFDADRDAVKTAIDGVQAKGETALYDALVAAAALVPPGSSRPSIVLLSDGGDTVSDARFERAMEALQRASAPLYAVALKSEEYDPKALELLAGGTGGKMLSASKSGELASLFEGIASEIGAGWEIAYTSRGAVDKDIEVDLTATSGSAKASAMIAFPNPRLVSRGSVAETFAPKTGADPLRLFAVVGLVFLSVGALSAGLMLTFLREPTAIDQLRYYDQLEADAQTPAGKSDEVRARIVDAVGEVAGRRGFLALVAGRLENAGLPLRPAEYIAGHLAAVVGLGVATSLLTGSFMLALAMVALATFGPVAALDSAGQRRRQRFERQLPDALAMIAGSLRGGWGVQQAMALVASESPAPTSVEFRRVETEVRLGMPLEGALQLMADRVDSRDFSAVVTAIAIQREVGGNLAELLDSVGATIRERESLRRQVHALTAEGRISAYILTGLPFLIIGVLLVVNPGYLEPLIATVTGVVVLLATVFLLLVGAVWMYRVTRIEV